MNTQSKLLLGLSLIIFVYIGVAFLAPIAMKNGAKDFGNSIYAVYERFCHQRVERSLFLFGKESFYTTAQLKDENYLPAVSQSNVYPEYFGHDFNGNEQVGFKVAVCIRDIALYLSFALSLFILAFVKNIKYSMKLPTLLLFPVLLDVTIQFVIEFNRLGGYYLDFDNNIVKRIVTGILAGIGCALLLKRLLENGLTNQEKIGNI